MCTRNPCGGAVRIVHDTIICEYQSLEQADIVLSCRECFSSSQPGHKVRGRVNTDTLLLHSCALVFTCYLTTALALAQVQQMSEFFFLMFLLLSLVPCLSLLFDSLFSSSPFVLSFSLFPFWLLRHHVISLVPFFLPRLFSFLSLVFALGTVSSPV